MRDALRVLAVLATALLCGAAAAPALAQDDTGEDDDLESLLEQVGTEYAAGYLGPLATTLGANQNSALYHTASIPWGRLTFGFGLKVMGSRLDDEDKSFRRQIQVDDLGAYLPDVPAAQGRAGVIVMEGPTAFGDTDAPGTMTGYVDGVAVGQETTIEGLVETDWSPLAAPEAWIGGLLGASLHVRWLPEIDAGDYGKTKYFGWGLQWSPNGYFPLLPVDVAVGFFRQDLDVGTILDTDAHSVFLAASKKFGLATLYTGVAKEKGEVAVSYVEEDTGTRVEFEMESAMKSRFTLGATLSLGAKLNVEAAFGNVTVYSAGLLFGM